MNSAKEFIRFLFKKYSYEKNSFMDNGSTCMSVIM